MTGAFSSPGQLLSLPVLLDPYPFYDWLRCRGAVQWSDELNVWLISGYAEASEVLRHPKVSSRMDIVSDESLDAEARRELEPLYRMQRMWMQQSDPPEHREIRGPWVRLLGPEAAQRMREDLAHRAAQMFARGREKRRFELIGACNALPEHVLGHVFGLDGAEMDRLRPWLADYIAFRTAPSLNSGRKALRAVEAWREALLKIVRSHREEGRTTGLTQVLERQGEAQMFATVASLVSGQYEPTVAVIGNATWALLRHPEAQAQCLAPEQRLQDVVDELIRFDCSFQSAMRTALEDIEIGGQRIAKGGRMMVLLGAANRDPSVFERPDEIVVNRPGPTHLAFGAGVHYCLGAAFARAITESVIGQLLRELPRVSLRSRHPDWNLDVVGFRGLRTLHLSCA